MYANTLVVVTFGSGNFYLYFMIDYLIAAIFVISLAITAGGILISSHLRKTYATGFLNSLLFFQVFWFTFGFYAIWGQIIVVSFVRNLVEQELLMKITNITIILGYPFLVFAGLMLLRIANEISGRKTSNLFLVLFLMVNIFIIPGTGYLLTIISGIEVRTVVESGFILLNLIYTITFSFLLLMLKGKTNSIKYTDKRNISVGLLLLMIVQDIALFIYNTNLYIALVFIFLFYLYGGFIPVYLRYKTDLSKLLMPGEINVSFDEFCEKLEISKREKEIIHEICKGLSNQQIADRLFISLQTVKDHTHRIYGKTNCISRAQLIRLVNDNVQEILPDTHA